MACVRCRRSLPPAEAAELCRRCLSRDAARATLPATHPPLSAARAAPVAAPRTPPADEPQRGPPLDGAEREDRPTAPRPDEVKRQTQTPVAEVRPQSAADAGRSVSAKAPSHVQLQPEVKALPAKEREHSSRSVPAASQLPPKSDKRSASNGAGPAPAMVGNSQIQPKPTSKLPPKPAAEDLPKAALQHLTSSTTSHPRNAMQSHTAPVAVGVQPSCPATVATTAADVTSAGVHIVSLRVLGSESGKKVSLPRTWPELVALASTKLFGGGAVGPFFDADGDELDEIEVIWQMRPSVLFVAPAAAAIDSAQSTKASARRPARRSADLDAELAEAEELLANSNHTLPLSTPKVDVAQPTFELGTADVMLSCRDCSKSFVFGVGEQDFYKERGFTPPTRCKECAIAKKEQVRKTQVKQASKRERRKRRRSEETDQATPCSKSD